MIFHTKAWKDWEAKFEGRWWNTRYYGVEWTKRVQGAWAIGLCIVFVGVPLSLQVVEPYVREKRLKEQLGLARDMAGTEPEALHDAVLEQVMLRRQRKAERRALAAQAEAVGLSSANGDDGESSGSRHGHGAAGGGRFSGGAATSVAAVRSAADREAAQVPPSAAEAVRQQAAKALAPVQEAASQQHIVVPLSVAAVVLPQEGCGCDDV